MTKEAPKSWMLDAKDPARKEIVEKAIALGITGTPTHASNNLGKIQVMDGNGGYKEVTAHVVHAVDPIITDGDNIVTILRSREPGLGKPCLPGGFIDPIKGGAESAIQAAAREALEEVSVKLNGGEVVGTRNMNRPFDIRVAQGNALENFGIKDGDIFMVSTQGVLFEMSKKELSTTKFIAADDAKPGSATLSNYDDLSKNGGKEAVGIPDHFTMMKEAIELVRSRNIAAEASKAPAEKKLSVKEMAARIAAKSPEVPPAFRKPSPQPGAISPKAVEESRANVGPSIAGGTN